MSVSVSFTSGKETLLLRQLEELVLGDAFDCTLKSLLELALELAGSALLELALELAGSAGGFGAAFDVIGSFGFGLGSGIGESDESPSALGLEL